VKTLAIVAVLLLAVAGRRQETAGCSELYWARSYAFDQRMEAKAAAQLRESLRAALPSLTEAPSATADLIIAYSESASDAPDFDEWPAPSTASWRASIFRFDCQSPDFGRRPTRAIGGRCKDLVHVRVALAEFDATTSGEGGVKAFTAALAKAIHESDPVKDCRPPGRWNALDLP
jgi:hypothetical protein